MGSRAASRAKIPGLPTREELAYLAGLLDNGGTVLASNSRRGTIVGLRITASPPLRSWLIMRFGGREEDGPRAWFLTQTAALLLILPRLRPFLIQKRGEVQALERLCQHLTHRESYHGTAAWRGERARLIDVVHVAAERRRAAGRSGSGSA